MEEERERDFCNFFRKVEREGFLHRKKKPAKNGAPEDTKKARHPGYFATFGIRNN